MKRTIRIFLIITLILTISGCKNQHLEDSEAEYIKFVYPDKNCEYWLIAEKQLKPDPQLIVNEIIKFKDNMIPKDTKLLGVKIENEIATINLSEEFENSANGDTMILVNIETIVNTLCINESLKIKKVIIQLDGERPKFINGIVNDVPFEANMELQDLY